MSIFDNIRDPKDRLALASTSIAAREAHYDWQADRVEQRELSNGASREALQTTREKLTDWCCENMPEFLEFLNTIGQVLHPKEQEALKLVVEWNKARKTTPEALLEHVLGPQVLVCCLRCIRIQELNRFLMRGGHFDWVGPAPKPSEEKVRQAFVSQGQMLSSFKATLRGFRDRSVLLPPPVGPFATIVEALGNDALIPTEEAAEPAYPTAFLAEHTMWLRQHGLRIFPAIRGRLDALEHLDLSYNQIRVLPEEIGRLVNLTSLDFSHNQIRALPEEIEGLVNLRSLNFSYNQISALPAVLGGPYRARVS